MDVKFAKIFCKVKEIGIHATLVSSVSGWLVYFAPAVSCRWCGSICCERSQISHVPNLPPSSALHPDDNAQRRPGVSAERSGRAGWPTKLLTPSQQLGRQEVATIWSWSCSFGKSSSDMCGTRKWLERGRMSWRVILVHPQVSECRVVLGGPSGPPVHALPSS